MTHATVPGPQSALPSTRKSDAAEEGASLIYRWWLSLEYFPGHRATLRRASVPADVFADEAFYRFLEIIPPWCLNLPNSRLAVVAVLLARVREDSPEEVARALGGSGKGISPFSGIRFRRLLSRVEDEELLRDLGRAIAMLKGRANVNDLARSLLSWGRDEGDRTRRRWALAYYKAAPKKKSEPAL